VTRGHFTKATSKFKDIQKSLGLPIHSLKLDKVIRWNSSLEIFKSAYATEGSIPVLSVSNFEIASKVITVLSPIEEITKNDSEDSAPISLLNPLVRK